MGIVGFCKFLGKSRGAISNWGNDETVESPTQHFFEEGAFGFGISCRVAELDRDSGVAKAEFDRSSELGEKGIGNVRNKQSDDSHFAATESGPDGVWSDLKLFRCLLHPSHRFLTDTIFLGVAAENTGNGAHCDSQLSCQLGNIHQRSSSVGGDKRLRQLNGAFDFAD
jgi:hypothetical protein